MIEHFFIVDARNFLVNAKPDDLAVKVREIFGDKVVFEGPRSPNGIPFNGNTNGHSVVIYEITGENFSASASHYPENWDANPNPDPKKRIIRFGVRGNGNDYAAYDSLVKATGLFDETSTGITQKVGVPVSIQHIDVPSDLVLAAYLLNSGNATSLQFNPYKSENTPPQFGVFVRREDTGNFYRAISKGSALPLP